MRARDRNQAGHKEINGFANASNLDVEDHEGGSVPERSSLVRYHGWISQMRKRTMTTADALEEWFGSGKVRSIVRLAIRDRLESLWNENPGGGQSERVTCVIAVVPAVRSGVSL
jgi:hypothetical protein